MSATLTRGRLLFGAAGSAAGLLVPALALLVLLAGGVSCRRGPSHVKDVRRVLGELVTIEVWGPEAGPLRETVGRAFAELEQLESLFSLDDPASEIRTLDRLAGVQERNVDPRTLEILLLAREWWKRTDGAFDPTIGPIRDLWGITTEEGPSRYGPDQARLDLLMTNVGMDKVLLNDISGTVRLPRKEMKLDLVGISTGYAVDRAVAVLRDGGAVAGRIEAGTLTRVFGSRPDGETWRIPIPHPRDPERTLTTIDLKDGAVDYVGDWQGRIFLSTVQRYYSGTIDPRSGMPADKSVMVVAVAPDATTADVVSQSAFILGRQRGGPFVRDVAGTEAIFIDMEPREPGKLRGGTSLGLQGKLEFDL